MPPGVADHGVAERIADGEPCSVHRCACGCVHVHIGALTVRFAAEVFRDLAAVMNRAATLLANEAPMTHRH